MRTLRRKNLIPAALALLTLLSTAPAQEPFDTQGWRWKRDLRVVQDAPVGLVRIELTPEIMDATQPDQRDLRVLDADGRRVRHYLITPQKRSSRPVDVRIINRSFEPGSHTQATLDFLRPTRKREIELRCSGDNFRRRLKVEGSQDGAEWALLRDDAWLFRVTRLGETYRAETVDLPVNNYRYLRLTLYAMPEEDRLSRIESAVVHRPDPTPDAALGGEVPLEVEWRVVPPAERGALDRPAEAQVTELRIDTGFRHVPVASLRIEADEVWFHRAYELCGRNATTETVRRRTETGWNESVREVSWRSVRRGVLYRVAEEEHIAEHLEIGRLDAPYRHLRLRIYNQDNPTLGLDAVTATRRRIHLVFDRQKAGEYVLLGGNPEARAPNYDLAQATRGVALVEMPEAEPGPALALAVEERHTPWSERYSVLILLVLAAAAAAMGGVIWSRLRQTPKP